MPGGLISAITRLLSAPFTGAARRDPELDAILARLDGRRVGLRLDPPDLLPLCLVFGPDGVGVEPGGEDTDMTLNLSPGAALRLLAGADFAELRAEGSVAARGDLEVAALLQRGLARLRHRCEGAENTRLRERVAEDLHRYFTDELALVPTAAEVAGFVDRVDELRLRVDRLSARIQRLQRHAGGPG